MIDMIFDIPIQSTYITLKANDVHYLFWAQLSVCDDMVRRLTAKKVDHFFWLRETVGQIIAEAIAYL